MAVQLCKKVPLEGRELKEYEEAQREKQREAKRELETEAEGEGAHGDAAVEEKTALPDAQTEKGSQGPASVQKVSKFVLV
jgi:hypothetical protein